MQTNDLQKPNTSAASTQNLKGAVCTLRLEPGPGNTRNSEGDFIRLKDGRWLFIYSRFLTGSGSDHDAAVLASRISTDDGKSWSTRDEIVVSHEGGFNVMSVTLRRLPKTNEIGLFYLRKNSMSDCRPVLRRSKDEGKTWSEPIEIIPETEIGYYVVNNDRILILPSGRLVVPATLHQNKEGKFESIGRAMCYLSDDGGKSWRRNRTILSLPVPGSKTGLQEPGVVRLRDGRILLWARTDQGTQWQSYSTDNGETFRDPQPGPLRSPTAPASIKRIPSTGELLAVWNDNYAPLSGGHGGARTPLAVAISSDEGRTWQQKQLLESDPEGWYCYTAIDFVGNGANEQILLAYCAGKGAAVGLRTLQITRFPTASLKPKANSI
jgi:sialidase-1